MKQIILSLLVSFSLSQSACTQNNNAGNQKVDMVNTGDPQTNKGSAMVKDGSIQEKDIVNEKKEDPVVAKEGQEVEKDGSGVENDGSASVKYGKYNCTASKYSNGSYEYLPKGSFVLSKDGSYTYHGFEKPSTGKFKTNDSGIISFTGGYFDGGEATPIEGRENRYYVVFPTIPDNRWTCSWVSEK